jgi:hypothetical protein
MFYVAEAKRWYEESHIDPLLNIKVIHTDNQFTIDNPPLDARSSFIKAKEPLDIDLPNFKDPFIQNESLSGTKITAQRKRADIANKSSESFLKFIENKNFKHDSDLYAIHGDNIWKNIENSPSFRDNMIEKLHHTHMVHPILEHVHQRKKEQNDENRVDIDSEFDIDELIGKK